MGFEDFELDTGHIFRRNFGTKASLETTPDNF